MRKNIIALCLMALFAQSVNAQGFFKKLGKALKESAQTIVTGGAVTQETKWGNITVKHLIPNMTVSVQNVERNGDKLLVTLLFTNTSSQKMQLWGLRARKVFDSQGTQYNSSCMVGNEWLTIGDSYSYFESQVPTKVVCSFGAVPISNFVVSMIKFETSYISDGKRYETPLEIRNITVPEYKPAANTTSTATTTAPNTQTAANNQTGAKIFKGEWSNKEGDCYLAIDLYAKSIEVEAGELSHGSFAIFMGPNSSDGNVIKSANIAGNTAELTMECLKGGKVTAKLTYNPANKTITVSNAKVYGDSWCTLDGMEPIVLNKKK